MVEPPGTRPPVQAATEEELLATKLHIAELRPGFLPRPRLLELRRMGHRPRHRRAGVTASGLGEPDRVRLDLRRRGDVR
jgi:hypothetical protein